MKKFLALLLALTMVLSLCACTTTGGDETDGSTSGTDGTTAATTGNDETEEFVSWTTDYSSNTVNAGSVTTTVGSADGGEVSHDVYAGISGKDYTDEEVYTLSDYLSGTTSMTWSPANWETSDDSYILDYNTMGFYSFVLNSTADGWSIVCEMAADYPEDVTSEYVGQYGIEEGDTGMAWKITLNEAACWEDGTPINADTYMYSYEEMLNPLMSNRRADSLYAGTFSLYNAKNYFYQGKTVTSALIDDYAISDLVKGDDGVYTTPNGEIVYVAVDYALDYLSGYTLATYVNAYGDAYFDTTDWDALVALADEDGLTPLTDESLGYLTTLITGNAAWNEDESYLPNYCIYTATYQAMSFDEVGMIKTGEYEIVFVTTSPIENAAFYVPYYLSSTYLLYEDLWESCKSYFDADGNTVSADSDNVASITSNYCTTVDTTMGYGPYKLTYFELDKQITLERNENWYGYSDGNHLGQYQTDIISCQIIGDQATALLAFLNGEVDSVSLTSDDMATYGTSDYILYTPQSYTTKITINTDLDSLATRGTEILANANFRKAFSLALDRTTFATSYTSAAAAGYGLLNTMYVYDPFSGASYRATDAAMEALVQLYGLTYGDDGDYGTLEEAYEAITGYDMTTAKELMQQAYEECVAAGYYTDGEEVSIQFSVYSTEDIYVQMINFFNDALASVTEGTGFEGKISISLVVDADYYNTMYSGNTDIIFSTWGGNAYGAYTILYECYCDASDGSGMQMEYGFDTSAINVTIEVDGKDYTTSLQTWALWCDGDTSVTIKSDDGSETLETFGTYDYDTQSALYARLEYAYLSYFTAIPIYYRQSASLYSQKINYAVTTYVDIVGYGGVQFATYNYTDSEWATYAASGLTY